MRTLLLLLLLAAIGAQETAARRPSLGITVDSAEDPLAGAAGLVVSALRAGSNGERLGLQLGDRILAVDGREVVDTAGLQAALRDKRGDDPIALRIRRGELVQELSGELRLESGMADLASRADALAGELAALRGGDPAAQPRYSLQELLVILRQIERDLPAAAAEFKRVYPEGRFRIAIQIDIDSHALDGGAPAAEERAGREEDEEREEPRVDGD